MQTVRILVGVLRAIVSNEFFRSPISCKGGRQSCDDTFRCHGGECQDFRIASKRAIMYVFPLSRNRSEPTFSRESLRTREVLCVACTLRNSVDMSLRVEFTMRSYYDYFRR